MCKRDTFASVTGICTAKISFFWDGRFVPYDGIEFNSQYSQIDVINDMAFLAMDLQFRGHQELSACFVNTYFEETGDYEALLG